MTDKNSEKNMTPLMLRAPTEIIQKAEQELLRQGHSKEQIANQNNLAVQLVENFFAGDIVDRHTYDLICQSLNILTDAPMEKSENQNDSDIHNLAQVSGEISGEITDDNSSQMIDDLSMINLESSLEADLDNNALEMIDMEAVKEDIVGLLKKDIIAPINRQCDRLKIIDINHPLKLTDLYVEINLFANLANAQYIDLDETFVNVSPEQYDRFYIEKLQPPRISANQALTAHRHLLLVGGLGSGKTTLLKHWAIAVNSAVNSNEQTVLAPNIVNRIPLYLPLRSLVVGGSKRNQDFHDFQPLAWIKTQLDNHGILDKLSEYLPHALRLEFLKNYQLSTSPPTDLADLILKKLLEYGAFLLLWDELDELAEDIRIEVAQQLSIFSDRYSKNSIVIATRNHHYNHLLQAFTALEVAPFQDLEINSFASKWFQITCPHKPKKLEKFQQLITTNQSIAEVATKPLFLTYLCNYFNNYEYIKNNFYQDLLNLLLTQWEQTKCLVTEAVASNQFLSVIQKQDLLSYVAIVSLDLHGYIWQNNQLTEDLQSCLNSSRTLSHLSIDRDRLYNILRWQHGLLVECAKGVHSMTHTALHDYLAAYRIANSNPAIAEKYLLDRIYLKRWHGVIVMTISIFPKADRMLQTMKRKIDEIVVNDAHLQSFLTWVNQQSIQIQTPYKAVTIRALYLDIDLENNRSLDRARALDIAHSRSLERARVKSMGIENQMETDVDVDYTINLALNLDLALYFANHPIVELACALEPDLNKGLQFLRQKLPDPFKEKERDKFARWWQSKGLEWSKKLRSLIMQHRKGSQDWKFSDNQLKVLRSYHDANKLLVECLNNAEYVSPIVKSQIESTLLLPHGEYSILGNR